MPNVTVKSCAAANTFKNEHGEFQVWKLQIVNEQGEPMEVELNTKLGKAGPSIDETFEATLTKGPYGWKAKRAAQNGGGGNSNGGGSKASNEYRSPEQIMRSYAQSQALQYWKLKHEGDPAYVIATWGEFQAHVELFYQDVKGAS